MISDADMKVIAPKEPSAAPSSAHVQTGVPIPKATRVRNFSPDEWEEFVEEWATTLEDSLRAQLKRTEEERDILKKAARYLAQHPE